MYAINAWTLLAVPNIAIALTLGHICNVMEIKYTKITVYI